ncbi:MAG: RNA methyltransferase [Actinomycetota bacterium]
MPDGVRLSGVIESPKNERVRRYRRLRKKNFRYREGLFIVEGLQCVAEALLSSHVPECLISNENGAQALAAYTDIIREKNVPFLTASDEVIASLSDTVTPQGMIAVSPLVHVELEDIVSGGASPLLIASRVRDPGNLGTMIRIADAAGAGGMVVCAESADLYNPKTVRSTAGSIFHFPIAVGADIPATLRVLRDEGYMVLAADAHTGRGMWDIAWPDKLALVVGNEAWGIPPEEAAMMDGLVKIPMLGRAESLNVAAAAAVLLYEAARSRQAGLVEEGDR